jgi:plasmid stability protein
MPQLVIDEIEDEVLEKIQLRAYRNRRTTQAEAIEILREAVRTTTSRVWASGRASRPGFTTSVSKRKSPSCAAIR